MDYCGASSRGLEVCTQEKSIITLTNGGGGNFKLQRRKRKENKRKKDDAHATKHFNGVHQ